MAGVRKVVPDEIFSMVAVQTTQRGIDDHGQRTSGSAGQAPQHGDGKNLLFTG